MFSDNTDLVECGENKTVFDAVITGINGRHIVCEVYDWHFRFYCQNIGSGWIELDSESCMCRGSLWVDEIKEAGDRTEVAFKVSIIVLGFREYQKLVSAIENKCIFATVDLINVNGTKCIVLKPDYV